jgi:hypothetical protein
VHVENGRVVIGSTGGRSRHGFVRGISGIRFAFTSADGLDVLDDDPVVRNVHVADPDTYTYCGLSGLRASFLDTNTNAAAVRNLVTGQYRNLTAEFGASDTVCPALEGNYAAYFKPDGSVWRVDLTSTNAPMQLAAATASAPGAGSVLTEVNDWVAWMRMHPGGSHDGAWRNARIMSATRAIPDDLVLAGASVSGPVLGAVQTSGAPTYTLRSWHSGAIAAVLPQSYFPYWQYAPVFFDQGPVARYSAPTVYGAYVGYLGSDGRPAVVALRQHVWNRSRSLGNPATQRAIAAGSTWSLDLPASAYLTSCTVVISRGATTVARLPCTPRYLAVGEVRASWSIPSGSNGDYAWTVVAANADGSMLSANGSETAPRGAFTVG